MIIDVNVDRFLVFFIVYDDFLVDYEGEIYLDFIYW